MLKTRKLFIRHICFSFLTVLLPYKSCHRKSKYFEMQLKTY